MIIDPAIQVPIGIGELAVLKEPKVITTVLGSCVSVCLYSREHKAGGMNHYALPRQINVIGGHRPFHYGVDAIPALVEKLSELTGAEPSSFTAKVVGGAKGLTGGRPVGKENIELAEAMLEKYKIRIVGSSTGGELGRKVIFYPDSGRLLVGVLDAAAAE